MGWVFEEFVRNFLKHEPNEFTVEGKKKIEWGITEESNGMQAILPAMETDISLRSADRYIIMETKFYKGALVKHTQHDEADEKIRSEHLYQLFAYLKNFKAAPSVEGILLYPTVGNSVDSSARFQGHKIRVVSVDLNRHWENIKTDLLGLLKTNTLTPAPSPFSPASHHA